MRFKQAALFLGIPLGASLSRRPSRGRISIRALGATLLLVTFTAGARFSLPPSGWQALARALGQFRRTPSERNSAAVSNLLPTAGHLLYDNSSEADKAYAQLEAALPTLETAVVSKNRSSVRLAFRLFAMADGHSAEQLDIMLGRLIRLDTVMFLDELGHAQPPYPTEVLGGLVGNLGEEFVDDMAAQCDEFRLRLKAIERIKNRRLAHWRATCSGELRRQLNAYCQTPSASPQ